MRDREHSMEGTLLDDTVTYTVIEFSQVCVIPPEMVYQMVEYGIVEPEGETREQWVFHYSAIERAKKALRLQRDFEMNLAGIPLTLDLIDEVKMLREMVKQLEKK